MGRKIFFISALSFLMTFSYAQDYRDILRYSNAMPYGTARFSSMGGAFSALGGDLSVMSFNPAGTGIYRRSDVGMTLGWLSTNVEASYNETVLEADKMNMVLPNIGFVIANPLMDDSEWKFVNVGISYNQIANFNRTTNIEGYNGENSALDLVEDDLNSGFINPDYDPYFQSGIIFLDSLNGDLYFFNDYNRSGFYGADISKTIEESGRLGEWNFNISANYDDKLYVGATLGFVSVNYRQTSIYSEIPTSGSNNIALVEYTAKEHFHTKGTGANLKLGMMYKATQVVRFGAAIQTPTVYNLMDRFYTEVDGLLAGNSESIIPYHTGDAESSWTAVKPFVFTGGSAVVIGKRGTVSAEVDIIDYGKMNLSAEDHDFKYENRVIKETFDRAYNVRTGAEYVAGMLTMRGGFAYYQSPYKNVYDNSYAHTYQISGGVGMKTETAYFDIAYLHRTKNEKHFLYDMPNTKVDVKNTQGTFLLTAGIRF